MPDPRLDDTIAALATTPGESGIAVIRVSGPEALKIAGQIFYSRKGNLALFASHTIHLGVVHNENKETIDQVLVSLFRAPHSYTAEDVVEISAHGGIAVTRQILSLLIRKGARHAEPGEFTKRAFLNGKLDLTQAEAVVDLIRAKSKRSLEIAARQLSGDLSKRLKILKDRLMKIYAHLEAYLDFPEEDIEVYSDGQIADTLGDIHEEIKKLLASFSRAALLREGVMVAIVGKPNVGKSLLFNTLLERDRALVSPYPGTTRDHLEEYLELDGGMIRLVDTAGLSEKAGDPLDQIGMERTRRLLAEAQLFLYIIDGSRPLEEDDYKVFRELPVEKPVLTVVNKCDLARQMEPDKLETWTGANRPLFISAQTRQGIEDLEQEIKKAFFGGAFRNESEQITRLRHKQALESASCAIGNAQKLFLERKSLEFVTLEVQTAVNALRELIGEVYSEDLLDVIFSEFCIGK